MTAVSILILAWYISKFELTGLELKPVAQGLVQGSPVRKHCFIDVTIVLEEPVRLHRNCEDMVRMWNPPQRTAAPTLQWSLRHLT